VLQVLNIHYITCPISTREGLGTRKHKKRVWLTGQTNIRRERRFVSSLEVSNVFQYNALQTIIQLQSLILYIQTSWFTYTVLLLSLKWNKTKCEIISTVQFFFGGGGACLMRWATMNIMAIEDGRFPLAYVTHTIKYLQQCKFSARQLIFEVIRSRMAMTKVKYLSRCWHGQCTCLCMSMYIIH